MREPRQHPYPNTFPDPSKFTLFTLAIGVKLTATFRNLLRRGLTDQFYKALCNSYCPRLTRARLPWTKIFIRKLIAEHDSIVRQQRIIVAVVS